MNIFFYGPNTYLIKREIDRLVAKYKEKAGGDLNLIRIDGEQMTVEEYSRQVRAVPLLATSRLIIIKNILKNKNKAVLENVKESLGKIPSTSVVVFVHEGEPDKRLGLFKALQKSKVSKSFANLERSALKNFILKETEARGGQIESSAADLLGDFVGGDLWRLDGELEKLISFCRGREISPADVELLVADSVESNVFALTDALAQSKLGQALEQLEKLTQTGEPALRILSLITYQFRTIAQVKEAAEKSKNVFAIVRATALSPYVVGKIVPIVDDFSWQRLAGIYAQLRKFDEEIKTGKIEGEEGLKELILSV